MDGRVHEISGYCEKIQPKSFKINLKKIHKMSKVKHLSSSKTNQTRFNK